MALTDTNEFTAYTTFNNSGVVTSDTFNSWRKKTNGIINELDATKAIITNIGITNITPSQLSLGAPTWTEAGALQTYNNGAGTFKASAITTTSVAASGTISTSGTISASTLNAQVAVVQGGITVGNIISNGVIRGTNLNITPSGGGTAVASISTAGVITGSSLNTGTGTITCGSITGSSLNTGTGTITCGSITGSSLKVGGSGNIVGGAVGALTLAIGTNNTQFTAADDGTVTAKSFNATSSLRYKENVQPLCNALTLIEKLQGVTFDWKETGQSDVGLIAEQVNEVLPQFVYKDKDGVPQAVDYGKITSVLIEAVKELSRAIKTQN